MIRNQTGSKIGLNISFPDGFSSGDWLIDYNYPKHIISIIAAGALFIWKIGCDAIFRNISPNYSAIVSRTLAHAIEYSQDNWNLIGKKLILSNFSSADGHTYANWSHNSLVSSTEFFISDSHYVISLAGCLAFPTGDTTNANITSIDITLQAAMDFHIGIQHIFTVNSASMEILMSYESPFTWRFNQQTSNVKFLLDVANNPSIHIIPNAWMTLKSCQLLMKLAGNL